VFQGLVIAQAVAQRSLELGYHREEPIVRGPTPQHPPEALDHLKLWTIARQSIALQMGERMERRGDQATPMPGSMINHEHHAGILGDGVGPGDVSHVAGKCLLHVSRLGRGVMAHHQACRESAGHQIECAKEIADVVTIQIADDRSVAFEPQGGPQRGNHREAGLILTQQHQFPPLGFF